MLRHRAPLLFLAFREVSSWWIHTVYRVCLGLEGRAKKAFTPRWLSPFVSSASTAVLTSPTPTIGLFLSRPFGHAQPSQSHGSIISGGGAWSWRSSLAGERGISDDEAFGAGDLGFHRAAWKFRARSADLSSVATALPPGEQSLFEGLCRVLSRSGETMSRDRGMWRGCGPLLLTSVYLVIVARGPERTARFGSWAELDEENWAGGKGRKYGRRCGPIRISAEFSSLRLRGRPVGMTCSSCAARTGILEAQALGWRWGSH